MRRRRNQAALDTDSKTRIKVVFLVICFGFLIVISRLFFWQIVMSSELQHVADDQYQRSFTQVGSRGQIYAADGSVLIANKEVYRLFAQPFKMTEDPNQISSQLAQVLLESDPKYLAASESAQREQIALELEHELLEKLSEKSSKWTALAPLISAETKQKIESFNWSTVGYDPYDVRIYPEASMAAHLTGFVGKDERGDDIGYFGIEGALEQELKARKQDKTIIADAFGNQLSAANNSNRISLNGRDVKTSIHRDIQHLAEESLNYGIERYGAKSGEIVILSPQTGDLLALAAQPKFDQAEFYEYDPSTYINPSLTSLYEPGSTFKLLTVAAGIDAGVISPDTICTKCSGPRQFGQYTIRTWNDVYNPNINMTDALAKSDNTAMIFASELLGAEQMKHYLEQFGIGEPINIDLQGDISTPFPQKWGPVELATISFGQGITATSLQLVRAVATIANDGVMMRPRVVTAVTDEAGNWVESEPVVERQVISKETADQVAKMMVVSAEHGEAQWVASKTHHIAGKTGTSQIATDGSYDEEKTIASFIGFAPVDDPQFVMLVKLVEPDSSPWAAETAAPLWYRTANDLFLMLNIPPDAIE